MRWVAIVAFVIIVFSLCLAPSARAQSQGGCDEKQWFNRPEPKTWGELYHLYKEFRQCDDGMIGEAFCEDVAQLFLKQWTHLDVLNRLITSDKAFKKFVLLHIDATLDEEELKGIAENARSRCPKWGSQLCHSIESAAQQGLKELHH